MLLCEGGDEDLVACWRSLASDDSHPLAIACCGTEVPYGDVVRGSSWWRGRHWYQGELSWFLTRVLQILWICLTTKMICWSPVLFALLKLKFNQRQVLNFNLIYIIYKIGKPKCTTNSKQFKNSCCINSNFWLLTSGSFSQSWRSRLANTLVGKYGSRHTIR